MIRVGLIITLFGLAQVWEVSAVGECAVAGDCSGNGMCFDFGYYNTYTCSCNDGFQGRDCQLAQNEYASCGHGNVYEMNDVIASEGDFLPHRFSCISFVNIHGADVVNLTVNRFGFEPAKDSLDIGIGYVYDIDDPSYMSYDNTTLLESMQIMSANFYIVIFTDKNIQSLGYNISLSADGDDCLSVLTPCMNGGTCVDGWQNYTCLCPPGYEGTFCEIDVDACRSGPCLNGGTCNTLTSGYTCDCTASYTGFNCETGVVIVDLTTPNVPSSFQVYEGFTVQTLAFDLTFSPSSMATYSIGGGTDSGLWQVNGYFSPNQNGNVMVGSVIASLTASQQATLWNPPADTTISSIQAPSIIVPSGTLCPSMQYFCARLAKGSNPSPDFELIGDPTDDALLGCTSIVCRGVEISSSSLTITSGALREGISGQTVSFNFMMQSVADAGGVSGTNLWQFTAFGSQNSAGSGTPTFSAAVSVVSHGSIGVSPGSTSQFNGLSFDLDLSGNINCASVPYICVTAAKGPNASPDFTLTGVPNDNVFTSCQVVTCRGVELTSSSVSVSEAVLEGVANNLPFSLSITSNVQAGTAIGSGLWQVSAYASAFASGTGTRYGETSITLNPTQAGTTLNAGSTATISALTFPLNLQNGPTCSQINYVCATIEKGGSAFPDFDLTPSSTTACTQVTCRGVEITSTSLTFTSGDLREGVSGQNVVFNFQMTPSSTSGAVSGSNLWSFTAFGSNNADGSSPSTTSYSVNLAGQGGVGVTQGSVATFAGLSFQIDLSGNLNCDDVPYICVSVDKGSSSNPDFTFGGIPNDDVLTACMAVTCRGVDIISSLTSVSEGVNAGQSNNVPFSITLNANPSGGTATGSGLWMITAYASANSDGTGTRYDESAISLSSSQAGTTLNYNSPATISGLIYPLDLTDGPACSMFSYICTVVEKGISPSPDFELTPTSTTSCSPIDCSGVEIITSSLASPAYVLEGESNSVDLSFSLTSNPNGGTAIGTGLWKATAYASADPNGNGQRFDEQSIPLSASQAATTLSAGVPTTISGLTFVLDTRDGPTCSMFDYICVEIEKGDNPSPDFELDPAIVRECSQVECRGVDISQLSLSVDNNEVFHGQTNNVILDVTAIANPSYGSVSGSNLWTITVWLSNNQLGVGRLEESNPTLRQDLLNLPVNSGQTSVFMDVNYLLDLSVSPTCTEFSYICVALARNPGASVDFELTGDLMTCIPLTCTDINECDSGPCLNGGTCNDLVNGYTCMCRPGFTGVFCEININECQSFPCQNGGTCFDRVNSYMCQCVPGFTGTDCETNINECQSNPCQNGATCTDLVNAYFCTCLPGYTGPLCSVNINECNSSPCENGGTCTDFVNYYQCTCLPGFTGTNCEINIDECASAPCQNGGTCNDGINGFTCTCRPGFTGTFCEIDINECASNPCLQGNCINRVNAYECVCFPGYEGTNCDMNINECASGPCQNGGQCIDEINMFRCNCQPGYTGILCETDINECQSGPCQNGGTCVDQVNQYTCNCQSGYTGTNCEININECLSGPCQNGGTCSDGINGFTCECAPGYTGTFCEININECASSPCLNGGTCFDGINMYTCQCTSEWTGTRCEISLNACRSNPCQNGGICVNTGTDYVCECSPGYAGTNCEIDINECASLPCQHGGRCIDGVAMFTCQCPQGFSGTTCEEVGFCDLEGEWYNEVNDRITISRTSTGMILGDYQNSVELLTGYSAPTVVVGYANRNCDFPSFGFVVTRDNGKSTTSWSGQCHLCDGEEVLYTTWTNTERVSTCSEIKRATLVGQDKWTRYQQSTAPRERPLRTGV